MFMVNIKKIICISLAAALLLCGCSENNNPTEESSTQSSSEASETTTKAPETSTEAPVTTPDDAIYSDDDVVPESWHRVYTSAEALERFDEIAYGSHGDISAEILSLMNRNVLCFLIRTAKGEIYQIDREHPAQKENSLTPTEVYPVISEYLSGLETVNDLVANTYVQDVADEVFNKSGLFTEQDGTLYIDANVISNWTSNPFFAGSYIEITDTSDDKCEFIWHYPDLERLNPPLDGLHYYYFERQCSASFKDGVWLLDDYIINN